MSVVGNFNSINNDGTTRMGGALQRRPSQTSSAHGHRQSISNYIPSPFHHGGDPVEDEETLDEFIPAPEARREEVHALARQMTRQSISSQDSHGGRISGALHRTQTSGSTTVNPWEYQEGSDLDPFSDSFDIRKWTKALVCQARGADNIPRYAGISFRHLSVHGFGSDAGG